jgi:hypothetical protein
VPRPKGEQPETSHGQLGDLVANGCTSRLLDGTAGILDGVIIKFSKDVDGRDHLVIVERLSSALIKHEDALKHGGRGTTNDGIDRVLNHPHVSLFFKVRVSRVILADLDGVVVVLTRDSRIVGVNPAIAPSLATGLKKGLISLASHRSSSSSHSGTSRGLMIDDIESTNRSNRSRSVSLRAAGLAARQVSQLPVAQRVKVDGSDKLK